MTPENNQRKGGARLPGKERRTSKKKTPRTREQIIRRRVTILAVVAAVMAILAVGLSLWIREPDIQPPPRPSQDVSDPMETGSGPVNSSDRRPGVYTFLLLGRDTGGGGNTDTMMVVSYDTKNQTVDVLNIYRDTMVNAPWDIKRINSVYNFNGGGEKGIEGLNSYLQKLIGFAPDYYIAVEWDAVGELVDAIGGVDFYVPYEMHYYDPTQKLRINQAKGQRKLNGDDAMQVIRWRKNNDGSKTSVGDVGRVEIQQEFLLAVMEKCLKTVNISTVPKFAGILMENVTTNLPLGNIVWFGQKALGLKTENMNFHSLPGNLNGAAWSRSYKNYQSYVLPDGEAIVELVNAHFNPYTDPVKLSDLDIMSVNRDGSLSSSSGVVRDAQAARPPVIPTKAPPEPQVTESEPPATEAPLPEESPNVTSSPAPSAEAPPEFQTTPPPAESPAPSEVPAPGPSETPVQTPVPTSTPVPSSEPDIPPEFLPALPSPVS